MEVVKSYFTHNSKCSSCNVTFSISLKRRACKVCSKLYSENLFCKNCSKAIRHPYLGVLKSKRYCNTCYSALDIEEKDHVESLPHSKDFNKKLVSTAKLLKKDPSKDYFMLSKIGKGATGTVYKCEKISTSELFAIKKIEVTPSFERSRVINEIGIMKLTIHPNIIQCFSAYEFQQ